MMISVVVCSIKPPEWKFHEEHIRSTIGTDFEYIRIDNRTNKYSLAEAYNLGVEKSLGEITLFIHEDLFFVKPDWGKVLENKFKDSEIGAVGVAGTSLLLETNLLWSYIGRPYIKGMVIHELGEKKEPILSVYSNDEKDSKVALIDGLFMAIRKSLFSDISFDNKTFDGFHMYDLDISMQINSISNIIVTEDILVKHLSSGTFSKEWKVYSERFRSKYKDHFPITVLNKFPEFDPLKRVPMESAFIYKTFNTKSAMYIDSIGHTEDEFKKLILSRQK